MTAELAPPQKTGKSENLSVTALYTAETWQWGGLPGAELLTSKDGQTVFGVTNFALAITRLFNWKVRSLKHSLLHRHAMIDYLLRKGDPRQVLELAAGLSRRGVWHSENANVRYTEVDLPHMRAHKVKLLSRSDAGKAALERTNWWLVEGDVLTMDLGPMVGPERPLFVIAEGLLMYLKPDQQRGLFRKVRELMRDQGEEGEGGTFVFDLVPACEEPKPGLFGRILGFLMKMFTGGKGFEKDSRTRDDIASDLKESGFDEVEMIEPGEVAQKWSLPFPNVKTLQLVFVARATSSAPQRDAGTSQN